MEIQAELNLADLHRWLERYGLHLNRRNRTRRGLRFVNAFEDPERLHGHISIYKTIGGATMTLKTGGGLDCIAEIHAGEDAFVTYLLERAARN